MVFCKKEKKNNKGVPELGSPWFFENKINKKNKGVPELGSPWFFVKKKKKKQGSSLTR